MNEPLTALYIFGAICAFVIVLAPLILLARINDKLGKIMQSTERAATAAEEFAYIARKKQKREVGDELFAEVQN